jgi:hypothetical protein
MSWSVQPDGLSSVLTDINARMDTILNGSVFYWIHECDSLAYDLTNAIVINLFSAEGESNIQNTITNVVIVVRAKGRPEVNIKRPATVNIISKEIGIFIVS